MKSKNLSWDQAFEMVTDLAHDLSSTPPFGFTFSQDDAWQCAAALKVILSQRHPPEPRLTAEEIRRKLFEFAAVMEKMSMQSSRYTRADVRAEVDRFAQFFLAAQEAKEPNR